MKRNLELISEMLEKEVMVGKVSGKYRPVEMKKMKVRELILLVWKESEEEYVKVILNQNRIDPVTGKKIRKFEVGETHYLLSSFEDLEVIEDLDEALGILVPNKYGSFGGSNPLNIIRAKVACRQLKKTFSAPYRNIPVCASNAEYMKYANPWSAYYNLSTMKTKVGPRPF